jgi:aminoglycoside phosphotransferase (APT) family kinase protein
VITWTFLAGDTRTAFRQAVDQDAGTWARARGWALWKALLTLEGCLDTDPELAAHNMRVIDDVLADHLADHDRLG